MTLLVDSVATRVVQWQVKHGRSHLPWQQSRDPYKVWLSEIMLQQTQVSTVLEYYARFLVRFPDVRSLASASLDDVLSMWSGLGYYSRARNLHRCAEQVVQLHGGEFPSTVEELAGLPGIGRSTAGAIAAFCFSQRAPILDANVRRVLTRLLGFDADLSVARNERTLWDRADALLPTENLSVTMPRYTQGMMDLGASLCTPKRPQCLICPLAGLCIAQKDGNPAHYPVKTRKLSRRSEAWWLLFLKRDDGAIWFETRPNRGIWAGLQCVPTFQSADAAREVALSVVSPESVIEKEAALHVLTHRDLYLHPLVAHVTANACPDTVGRWMPPAQWSESGLPAPVRKMLATIF